MSIRSKSLSVTVGCAGLLAGLALIGPLHVPSASDAQLSTSTAAPAAEISSNLQQVASSDDEFRERLVQAYIRDNPGASRAQALSEISQSAQVTQAVQDFKDEFPGDFAGNAVDGDATLRIFTKRLPSSGMHEFVARYPIQIDLAVQR